MDIRSTVLTLGILTAVGAVWLAVSAAKHYRRGKRIPFFFKRRKLMEQAASLVIGALLLAFFAFASFRWGEGLAYRYFPPTLTPSLTSTITLTPTIHAYTSITPTPTSPIPPVHHQYARNPERGGRKKFESIVTPDANSVFSADCVRRKSGMKTSNLSTPASTFENPLTTIMARTATISCWTAFSGPKCGTAGQPCLNWKPADGKAVRAAMP